MLPMGILAHSADGAALCFLEMVRESGRRLGEHRHPEITLSILPMEPVLAAYESGDLATVRAHLARTAQRLADAGCAFFVCSDNTAHLALESPGPPFPLPGLHVADVVASSALEAGFRRVGLLGTKWTMAGPVYPAAFARAGVSIVSPPLNEHGMIDDVIFAELCQGVLRDESRREYARVISGLKEAGCDAVALSCTEIPLLISPADSPLPTLDSTRLLARAAVAVSLGAVPLPTWRAGRAISST